MATYWDVLNRNDLTPEQKAREIQAIGELERQKIDKENLAAKTKMGVGAILQGASALPIFNVPYVGTGLGGAVYELGTGIAEGNKFPELAKRTGQGFVVGETVGAIPYVGKFVGKTKAGQAIGEFGQGVGKKFMDSALGQKVAEIAPKVEDALMTDIKAYNPFKQTQTVYHGSPKDFNNFTNEAIGTGEGAQAHGYGHYAALDKDVADRRYRKRLSSGDYEIAGQKLDDPFQEATLRDVMSKGKSNVMAKYEKDLLESKKIIDDFESNYTQNELFKNDDLYLPYSNAQDTYRNTLERYDFIKNIDENSITKNEGQLYKLSIPKDDVILREGATFAEQPVKVQEMYRQAQKNKLAERLNEIQETKDFLYQELENAKKNGSDRLIYATEQMLNDELPILNRWTDDITEQLKDIENNNYYDNLDYKALLTNLLPENSRPTFRHLTNKESQTISEQLNKAGIKGISYNGGIDGEARVIFNPDDIEIVRKYYNQPSLAEFVKNRIPNMGAITNSLINE